MKLIVALFAVTLLVACNQNSEDEPSTTDSTPIFDCTWHSSVGMSVVVVRNDDGEVVGAFTVEGSVCGVFD